MKILFLFVCSIYSISAFSDWSAVNKIDDFTDEKVAYAAYSDENHRIQISREGMDVWMFITRNKIGAFEPNTIIEFRVDRNDAFIIDPKSFKILEAIGKKAYQWEPDTIGFLIWHGVENQGCGFIDQLTSGKILKGRYQVSKMERDTFSVSLAGAKSALIKGLELKNCGK